MLRQPKPAMVRRSAEETTASEAYVRANSGYLRLSESNGADAQKETCGMSKVPASCDT
jgi:hypothetical protein